MKKMKVLSKEITNSEGQTAIIKKFKGVVDKCVLEDENGNRLTPIFDSIKYNRTKEAFLVAQSYNDVYEDGRPSTFVDTVYFYIDFSGKPISYGYAEYLDDYYPIEFVEETIVGDNLWFTGLGVTLRNIGLDLGQELIKRRKKANSKILRTR